MVSFTTKNTTYCGHSSFSGESTGGRYIMHKKIRKRDGRYVKFDASKITNAIAQAGKATGEFNGEIN